jgi:molybdopterin biosynthesis enzyme
MPTLGVAKIKPTTILPTQPLSVSTIMVALIQEILLRLDREVYPMYKSKSFKNLFLYLSLMDFSLFLVVQI